MKVIIAGSREITDKDLVYEILDSCDLEISEVVCGTARGPDTIGEFWAKDRGIPVKYFKPDWKGLGKKAGSLRNIQMGDYADALVAIWDGKSNGTRHMIEYARNKGLTIRVFYM